MSPQSAGILLFRRREHIEVLLAHPGGPFWARKDEGAWSIPKGEIGPDETPQAAALREFEEETGFTIDGSLLPLGEIRQKSGKRVHAWACEQDLDPSHVRSNNVRLEWPRGSGRMIEFPEIDRCEWFALRDAELRINPAQRAFLDRLLALASD